MKLALMPSSTPQRNGSWIFWPTLLAMAIFVAGCSVLWRGGGPSGVSPYTVGVLRMTDGEFADAERAFRESASRCESGWEGRRALLFLSLLAMDPRNPHADPDSAAMMAARVLFLPGTGPSEALEAEGLYVAALDRGADPGLRPEPSESDFALRFERCGYPVPKGDEGVLPALDSTTVLVVPTLDVEKRVLMDQNGALQRTIEELQAELERIRGLLSFPDTGSVHLPSGS